MLSIKFNMTYTYMNYSFLKIVGVKKFYENIMIIISYGNLFSQRDV